MFSFSMENFTPRLIKEPGMKEIFMQFLIPFFNSICSENWYQKSEGVYADLLFLALHMKNVDSAGWSPKPMWFFWAPGGTTWVQKSILQTSQVQSVSEIDFV